MQRLKPFLKLLRIPLLIPVLLYLAAKFTASWHKGICQSTRRALYANKYFFEKLVSCVQKDMSAGRSDNARSLARLAARFAAGRNVGFYSSPALELPFLELAAQLPMPPLPARASGTLHVMTCGYLSGGHTQLVRRWIELIPDEVHHLFISAQGEEALPPELEFLVRASGGRMLQPDSKLAEPEAAAMLRAFGLQAERIVLHTHMDDPLPVIAFGHSDFPRPVLFMNHADHKFWLGRSVADLVLEMRPEGESLSRKYRGAATAVISLPFARQVSFRTQAAREEAGKKLGLPPDRPVLLTVAAPYKYTPVAPYDMRKLVQRCLEAFPGSIYLIGGAGNGDALWLDLKFRYGERVRLLGLLSREELLSVFNISDVYIDSIPLGGGMTCLDAAQNGLPVLTHNIYRQAMPFIRKSGWEFASTEELLEGVSRLIKSQALREQTVAEQKKHIEAEHSPQVWVPRVLAAASSCKSHMITQNWAHPPALGDYQIFSNCVQH